MNMSNRNHNNSAYKSQTNTIKATRLDQSNGSFVQSPSTPTNKKTPDIIIKSPVETELNKTLEEAKPSASRCCIYCGDTLKISKEKIKANPLVDFNLDYSPNKKCANFIETNTFIPGSPAPNNIEQNGNNIQCSAKKSLLGLFLN